MENSKPQRVWTVAEAKAHLSEILRLAEVEGPQTIGTRRPCVVVPADTWYAKAAPRKDPLASGSLRTYHAAPILRFLAATSPNARFHSATVMASERL